MDAIERLRSLVRGVMRSVARALDGASGGHITPTQVTIAGVLLHGVIAFAIIKERLVLAGIMLVVFGLLDTLDGELARLQKRQSNSGVVLDATADRYKEGLLYTGLAVLFAERGQTDLVALSVLALTSSFLITFVKAKGEAVLATIDKVDDAHALNHSFGENTYLRFEIRMALLVIGLISGWLQPILYILAAGGLAAGIIRFMEIDRRLR